MDDPNVICIIKGIDRATDQALLHPDNEARIWHSTRSESKASNGSSTPPLQHKEDPFELRLTFDHRPKNLQRGFVFGTDPRVCDVLFGPSHRTISRSHFCITFDEHRRLVVEDSSTHGTTVSYNGQAEKEVRRNFRWILFHDMKKNVTIHLPLYIGYKLILRIEGLKWAGEVNRRESTTQYGMLLDSYLEERRVAIPPLGVLGIQSQITTLAPTGSQSPRQDPIYIKREKLGSGSFGTVHRMINVSTGEVHAGKTFGIGSSFKTEIAILKSLSHEHIVRFIDFIPKGDPLLLMEYFPMRSLESQHRQTPITKEETQRVLLQGLQALDYLHTQHIVHRDLKPENILVRCRPPLSIALADFGLSNQKDNSFFETICGTYPYCAPEILERSGYFTAVDIWALGVVVLEYLQGIPVWKNRYTRDDLPWWTESLAATAVKVANADPENRCHAILMKMLQLDHWDRPSAGECLIDLSSIHQTDESPTSLTSIPVQGPLRGSETEQHIRIPYSKSVTEAQDHHQSEASLLEDFSISHYIKQPSNEGKRKHLSSSPRPTTDGEQKRQRNASDHLDVDAQLQSSKICLYLRDVSTVKRLDTERFGSTQISDGC